eukprot:scaffold262_cov230-Pinguiococcus_pyrenoidosus.AAC.14
MTVSGLAEQSGALRSAEKELYSVARLWALRLSSPMACQRGCRTADPSSMAPQKPLRAFAMAHSTAHYLVAGFSQPTEPLTDARTDLLSEPCSASPTAPTKEEVKVASLVALLARPTAARLEAALAPHSQSLTERTWGHLTASHLALLKGCWMGSAMAVAMALG